MIVVLAVAVGIAVATRGSGTSGATTTAVQPTGIPGTWTLKFADEFNGTAIDTTKWTPGWFGTGITDPLGSNELQDYSNQQVTESGGNLALTAIAKTTTAPNGRIYHYQSGLVSTNGKFNFTYGAVEARVYLPGTAGKIDNWPAFWLDCAEGTWPQNGEIDVMEGISGHAAWHFQYKGANGNHLGPGANVPGDWTGWHTFGAKWQAGRIDFYYDGVLVGSQTQGVTSAPLYVLLNNAISGTAKVPDSVLVDYVRVWQ